MESMNKKTGKVKEINTQKTVLFAVKGQIGNKIVDYYKTNFQNIPPETF